MTRSFHQFNCDGDALYGTLDSGSHTTALLIVSGGNEIRAGAHAGMARLAESLSQKDFPVFRYDRRGIGDSSGHNGEFLTSRADILAATQYLGQTVPNLKKIIGFGNCDAATSLALFSRLDGLILANPWVIETSESTSETASKTAASAIRARYWNRLKNPRTIIDALSGKIDFRKFLGGLKQVTQKQENTGLSIKLRDALLELERPCRILLAKRDTTALAFQAAWNSSDFRAVKTKTNITSNTLESASHSFADDFARKWLENEILEFLESA
ncbi:hydrolase 1, exosortase A system-associated [Parasphingorhabdus halotolerans]|uniref:Hydrolase 1, exosortase A system-associated n=1 Tax=Parasphingorhabdus halotolerans TaxID=2725558 RepID=A0A6H2DIF7_9SPHN|nr:hydrolase 1, exosortase A system-associated [Parasphingorhabdus halotolerans]QJB68452.1 hydrolase 1, exosortase A system-associated [Parasphingorhabdus halotolerans]